MKMRFTLATLWRLRKLREEQERAKLAAANSREAQAAQDLEQIESLLRDSSRIGNDEDGMTWGSRLRFAAECRTVLGSHLKRAKQRAQETKAEAFKQEQCYLAAQRDFEILESLRKKQMEIFRTLELRQEQRELDESHALVRTRQTGQGLPIGTADVAQETGTTGDRLSHGKIGNEKEDL